MLPLEKQVCSLDLAKKLKELGVKQESYFAWCEYPPASPPWTMKYAIARVGDFDDYAYEYKRDQWSAFTVAELGEMLPPSLTIGDIEYQQFSDRFHDKWLVGYAKFYEDDQPFADTEADARAKMLVYLIENKLITLQ